MYCDDMGPKLKVEIRSTGRFASPEEEVSLNILRTAALFVS